MHRGMSFMFHPRRRLHSMIWAGLLLLIASGCSDQPVPSEPAEPGAAFSVLIVPAFTPSFSMGDKIRVANQTSISQSSIDAATSDWNDAVLSRFNLPKFVSSGWNRTVTLKWGLGTGSWYCGSGDPPTLTITIHRSTSAGDCGAVGGEDGFSGRVQASGLSRLISHELSHLIGFKSHGTPPYCISQLNPDGTFGTGVCQYEIQEIHHYYLNTALNPTATPIVTGVRVNGPNAVGLGESASFQASFEFDRGPPELGEGAPVQPGDIVTWGVMSGSGLQIDSSANGSVYVTGTSIGSAVLKATFQSSQTYDEADPFALVGSDGTKSVTVSAPPHDTVYVYTGNNQSAGVNSPVAIDPAVRVLNGSSPVVNRKVVFQVMSGGGTVTNGTAYTNANGIATVGSWTLGSSPGTNTLRATVLIGAVAGNPVTFTATATPPPCQFNTSYVHLESGESKLLWLNSGCASHYMEITDSHAAFNASCTIRTKTMGTFYVPKVYVYGCSTGNTGLKVYTDASKSTLVDIVSIDVDIL